MSGAFDTRAAARHGCHVTNSSAPNTPISGPDLLRANNLQVEGPTLWGHPVSGNVPGVFIVELPAPHPTVQIDATAVRDWLNRMPGLALDGKRPTVGELQSRLASYWLPGQVILYIGSSRKSVASRLLAMHKTTLGERRPQPTGYWLKVLKDLPKARIWWSPSTDPELDEDQLLEQFVKVAGSLPFAVLSAPGGQRRDHGITGALRPDETAPPAKPRKVVVLPDANEMEMQASSGPVGQRPPTRPKLPPKPRAVSPNKKKVVAPTTGPSAIETVVVRRSARVAALAAKQAQPPTHLTADGLAAMQVELHELTQLRRPEVIARIKAARELGDLRENADYESARKEQSFLEGRVQQLERMLKGAVIIETEGTGSVVGMGSTVVIATSRHGEETFTIVGSAEADVASGRISYTSPIGRALMGRRAGEMVRVDVPAGTHEYTIVRVS
jgi:transcription elongation factor GreA